MTGPLAGFAKGLAGPDDVRTAVRVGQSVEAALQASLQALERRTAGPVDRRAAVSVWTLAYFETVLPPLLAGIILLGRMPCADIDRAQVIVSPDGAVLALKVFSEQPLHRRDGLQVLLEEHVSPFVARVASLGAVSGRVVWSNAGHITEAFLGMIASVAAGTEGLARARALLASSHLGGGNRNPLFRPVRYQDGRRIRRVCCLRFLTPAWPMCAVCPLPDHHPARARRVLSPAGG